MLEGLSTGVSGRVKPLDLAGFLPYQLSVLANQISSQLARVYAERFKLSIPEWRVMAVLGQFPGMSALEVGARTEMDRVTVSRAVARLLAKRYVARNFSALDRRRSELRLSARGQAIYAEVVPLARAYERSLSAALTPAQRRALDRAMVALRQQASALAEATPSALKGRRGVS